MKSRMMVKIGKFPEKAILGLIWLLSHLPFRVLYMISDLLYYPFYHIVRYRRKIVRKNLLSSFPEKRLSQIKEIERRFYKFFIDIIVETIKFHTISSTAIRRRAIFKNTDRIHKLLSEGKSISVFIGHFGNWEWIPSVGLWFDKNNVTIVQIFRKLNSKIFTSFLEKSRGRFNDESVEMHDTVMYISQANKKERKLIIGFLADQSPKQRDSKHFINFFNHRIPVITGTEKLTRHFGFAAMFLKVRRLRRGYYEFELTELEKDVKNLSEYELTSLYFKQLEKEIRAYPELYLWTHNRFKYEIPKTPFGDGQRS